MATLADITLDQPIVPPPAGNRTIAFIDRWIWVFMAALLIAVVLAGFIPDRWRWSPTCSPDDGLLSRSAAHTRCA